MLSKELAMEESVSISRDYNIDINTAMELVLESSIYDYEENNIAMESLLGKSMKAGPRFLSAIKRFFSFIANAIRAMIASLTKNTSRRKVALNNIGSSVGNYIKRSSELITKDITSVCEKCTQCVKDMSKTIDPIHKSLTADDDGKPDDIDDLFGYTSSGDLSFNFKNDPEEIKADTNEISQRFSSLKEYCYAMKNKYSEGKTQITFVDTSISEIIDKNTSDKLVSKLHEMAFDIGALDKKVDAIQSVTNALNRSGSPKRSQDEVKQSNLINIWKQKTNAYTATISSAVVTMKSIICAKGNILVPSNFFADTQQARAKTAATAKK